MKRILKFDRLRGLTGAKDEVLLTATAQNLRRLAKLLCRPTPPLAVACPADAGFQFRDTIAKASKALVKTGVFHQEKYAGLSGLLCSRVDAANRPDRMGDDFQVVPNPQASVPLPDTFRLRGTYFRIEQAKDGYIATPEASRPAGTGVGES